ncbi:uncharacterized protein ACNLHF_000321 isoform 2-T4 [Anomaloglossus baeobatrachus]|uniref:uncharacterized protein LOC142250355 isoform X2 n=1 Tax=Anomaloglossus baeobatrachus TaxID=238106 RepID=UPI003F500B4A
MGHQQPMKKQRACSVSAPPSLSLSFLIGQKTPALQCLLCPDKKASAQRNFTFTLTRNGKVTRFSQISSRRIVYTLENKKNHTGLWRCHVLEFPNLRADYYLGPPVPAPPAEKKKDAEETSSPPSAVSTKVLLTIATAAVLLLILIIVTSVTSGICIRKRCRKKSTPCEHRKDGDRSDHFPLTENLGPILSNPDLETDTEVSYVELEIIRDPSRKPSKSINTIYANIV